MRRRRRLQLGLSLSLAVVSLAVACSFPNPILVLEVGGPLPGEAGTDGTTGPDLPDATVPPEEDAGDDGAPVQGKFDGGDPDAAIVKDAGMQRDAMGCTGCDCDGDGYNKPDCGFSAKPRDCDDNDSRYRPDQGFLDVKPAAGSRNGGDWNCDGEETKYFNANQNCADILLSNCTGQEGFRDNPGCGQTGEYIFCRKNGIICEDNPATQTRTQACQ